MGDAPQRVEQVRELQAELDTCQQAVHDLEVAGLDKDRRLAALEARCAAACAAAAAGPPHCPAARPPLLAAGAAP